MIPFVVSHRKGRYRSNLERLYSLHLVEKLIAQEITMWEYEPFSVHMADRTSYTADFVTQDCSGMLSFIEVKGWSRSYITTRTKWNIAAEKWPCFRWLWVTRANKEWKVEEYGV